MQAPPIQSGVQPGQPGQSGPLQPAGFTQPTAFGSQEVRPPMAENTGAAYAPQPQSAQPSVTQPGSSFPVNQTLPMSPLQQTAAPSVGSQPAAPQPVAITGMQPDEGDTEVQADDVVWINRAKRVIADTKGDPRRQTQLIQHLRTQYLKQRYNRQVGAGE